MTSITRVQSIPVRVVAREKPAWRIGKFLRGLLSRLACIQMHFTLSDLQADHMLGSDEHNKDVSLSVSRTNAVKHVLDLKEDRPANNSKRGIKRRLDLPQVVFLSDEVARSQELLPGNIAILQRVCFYRISIVLASSCGQAKTLSICYRWPLF